eukprot:Skav210432  [mRNA]  locus=scaffold1297:37004:37692:- [translate_table: standard]
MSEESCIRPGAQVIMSIVKMTSALMPGQKCCSFHVKHFESSSSLHCLPKGRGQLDCAGTSFQHPHVSGQKNSSVLNSQSNLLLQLKQPPKVRFCALKLAKKPQPWSSIACAKMRASSFPPRRSDGCDPYDRMARIHSFHEASSMRAAAFLSRQRKSVDFMHSPS